MINVIEFRGNILCKYEFTKYLFRISTEISLQNLEGKVNMK